LPNFQPPPEVSLLPAPHEAALGERWRALEAVCDAGFFRSWAFLGCQRAMMREPHLLAVRQGGHDMVLALVSRRGGRFFAGETGDPAHDALFLEHGGCLVRPGAEAMLAPALAALCARRPVVLAGVDAAHLAATGQAGLVVMQAERFAPVVELDALQGPFLASLSGNARSQIARSMRLYGPDLAIARAPDVATGLAWFGALVALHQARWRARGEAGAFGDARLVRFHQSLIRAGLAEGAVDVLRISAAGADVGYLYNVRQGGWVMNYQSGLVPVENAQLKPGLVCHALAIERYRAEGARTYDLLAGPQRYKTTLAPHAGQALYWLTLYAPGAWAGRARLAARRVKAWLR
jgi:CelD/BcsL family acetyltransferase involved in cellulose biosynthesis